MKKSICSEILSICFLSLILIPGCDENGGEGSGAEGEPAITDFSANPATIHWYQAAEFSATFTGGTGVITPGNLSITSGGRISIAPTITTTYTLTVTNSLGATDTRNITVNVKAATEQDYIITDLGSLGGATITPAAVNDVGQVVGTATLSDGSERAFFGENGILVNLGTFPGYPDSQASSINNSGQVVGTCPTETIYPPPGPGPAGGKYPTSHAFIWEDGIMEHLGTANVSDSHTPNCINDSGIVVGAAQTAWHPEAGLIWYDAVQWENGNLYTLSGGEDLSLGSGTHAIAVNSAAIVVGAGGRSIDPNGSFHAYLWEGGKLTDMNTLVPDGSPWFLREAVGVNTRRQIIGNGVATGLSGAFIWEEGIITDIGSPFPGGRSDSRGINAAGAVVGRTTDGAVWRAFVWRDSWIADLNELIPSGSGWILEVAISISDTGFIVGTGKHNGVNSAFILTPQ